MSKLPRAVREQVWLRYCGPIFQRKCWIEWCVNPINVFDFECGHNIPQSKGGSAHIDNLRPLCARCNKSMGHHYTIDEWNALHLQPSTSWWSFLWTYLPFTKK